MRRAWRDVRERVRQFWLRRRGRHVPTPCSSEELRVARLEAETRRARYQLEREIRMGAYREAWQRRWLRLAPAVRGAGSSDVLRFARPWGVG